MFVEIGERDFSNDLADLGLDYFVDSAEWDVMGGPDRAKVTARGAVLNLWELVEKLRCPIWMRDPVTLDYSWWGYVRGVKVTVPAPGDQSLTFGVSLEQMRNKYRVTYQLEGVTDQSHTAWTQDDDSIATYGTQESQESNSEATTQAAAEQLRDTLLAIYKFPLVERDWSTRRAEIKAEIDCRGWWETLDWRFYGNAGTNTVETTTQIATAVGSHGQFITAVEIENASGISTVETRNGDETLLEVVESLMKKGTTSKIRLLATVDYNRRLHVYAESLSSFEHYIQLADGSLTTPAGKLVRMGEPGTVAVWADLDVVPGSVDVSKIANVTPFFIEHAHYDGKTGKIKFIPRGQLTPRDVLGIG